MSCLIVWSQLTDVCVSGVINEDRLRELLTTMGDRFKDSEVLFCCCCCVRFILIRTPASAAVAVDSSHMIVPSSTLWSRFSPPSNFVNGYVLTMRFMVCLWPQSQEGDWARRHLCKLAWHGPRPVWKQFIRDHVFKGWLSDSRVVNNSVVDRRSRRPVLSPLRNCVDRCHVWSYWASRCKPWRWMLKDVHLLRVVEWTHTPV